MGSADNPANDLVFSLGRVVQRYHSGLPGAHRLLYVQVGDVEAMLDVGGGNI
jgi:hypothetical protein